MIIYVPNKNKVNGEYLKVQTRYTALKYITIYPLNATDLLLDKYLKQNYSLGLKSWCRILIMNVSLMCPTNSDYIVGTFKDSRFSKVARLITYGTGKLTGSKILRNALTVLK